MSFEAYMAAQIQRIANGDRSNEVEFQAHLTVYLGLIARGMSPQRAKRIMDLYIE